MNVLFFSQRFLLPMDNGGKIRTGKILEQISKKFNITLISGFQSPKDDNYIPEMNQLCNKFIPVADKRLPKFSFRFYLKTLYDFFSPFPIALLNDYSNNFERALLKELHNNKYDLAICDFLQPALNFRKISNINTILFQHNVESFILKRHAQQTGNIVFKLFWYFQYKKMLRQEKKIGKKFQAVIAVSELDKQNFTELFSINNVYSIPTGVDVHYFRPVKNLGEKKQFVFVGSMDWIPNQDAMRYFIKDIFPKVKRVEKDIKLVIVGGNPPSSFNKLVENRQDIILTGWVEDVRPIIAESLIYIVPLRIGGGTRIKIFEAMAMEKPVVSTTIGAEGLPVVDNKHILLADDPDAFTNRILQLLKSKQDRTYLGVNARKYVEKNFSWDRIADKFANICESVVANKI